MKRLSALRIVERLAVEVHPNTFQALADDEAMDANDEDNPLDMDASRSDSNGPEVDENDDVDVGVTNRLVMSNMFNPDDPVGVGIINSMGISNMSNLDDSGRWYY